MHYYSVCNVKRIKFVEAFTFNMITGECKFKSAETVTEEHGTPLFSEEETTTGICRACRQGWEVEGNTFASPEERERATGYCRKCYGKGVRTPRKFAYQCKYCKGTGKKTTPTK